MSTDEHRFVLDVTLVRSLFPVPVHTVGPLTAHEACVCSNSRGCVLPLRHCLVQLQFPLVRKDDHEPRAAVERRFADVLGKMLSYPHARSIEDSVTADMAAAAVDITPSGGVAPSGPGSPTAAAATS